MTLKEFNEINWHRGNTAKLKNGKEYLVKGTKGHGRYLLLYSAEYNSCFVADYNIVDSRTSDYEEPDEVYLEKKRQRQLEAEAKREEERLMLLQAKAERKRKNLEEQERIHQEALQRKAAKAKMNAKPAAEKTQAEPVAAKEEAPEQPKKKRKRITIVRAEKIEIK